MASIYKREDKGKRKGGREGGMDVERRKGGARQRETILAIISGEKSMR